MIHLNYRDARPINEQVRDGLRQLLISQAIAPGEKQPSVRALAAKLAINPNTIQRAYEALEHEGYLYTIAGKGTFAAPRSEVNDNRREELIARFDSAASELLFLGMTVDQLCQRIRQIQEGGVRNG